MNLELLNSFQSIEKISAPENLPNFMILTGLNGSGKTHLLKGIEDGAIQAVDSNGKPKTAKFFDYSSLRPRDQKVARASRYSEKKLMWQVLKRSRDALDADIRERLSEYFGEEFKSEFLLELVNASDEDLISMVLYEFEEEIEPEVIRVILGDFSEKVVDKVESIFEKETSVPANQQQTGNIFTRDVNKLSELLEAADHKPVDILNKIEIESSIPLIAISKEMFDEHYPLEIQREPFERSFSLWFVRYASEFSANKLLQAEQDLNYGTKCLSDKEFKKIHGDIPWEFTNKILEEAKLPFFITRPPLSGDEDFRAELIDKASKEPIPFDNLSSGEKIIMSLAVSLSYASETDTLEALPDLLLLDEIDAPLHPSMTEFMLKVIQDVLIKEKNISVIMTTHSPSTVAMAPDEAIFELKKQGVRKKLEKVEKDYALALLTTGIPTLSVSYKNQRQVFVESKYDAGFFASIYLEYQSYRQKQKNYRPPEVTLSFLSSGGSEKGNCDMVKHHVTELRKNGNDSVYGVIDWDSTNKSSDWIFVLSEDLRYNIETCLLDPLIIACLLIRDTLLQPSELNMDDSFRTHDVLKIDNRYRQKLADAVLSKIRPEKELDETLVVCHYFGKFKLKLPVWFLRYQGHELEGIYKENIPQLRQYRKEADLKKDVLGKVIHDYPELLPMEFIEIMNALER